MNEVIKVGPYNIVSLISADADTTEDKVYRAQRTGIFAKTKGLLFGRFSNVLNEVTTSGILARHIVEERRISVSEVKKIPLGSGFDDEIKRANILVFVAALHDEKLATLRREGLEIPSGRATGILLADFCDLVPPNVASRILLSAADPNVARTIFKNEGTLNYEGIDPQVLAVESMVLLPRHQKMEIFREMVKQSPGKEGKARRLLSLIASNWTNSNSDYCGIKLIYTAGLEPEDAVLQIEEVGEDFIPMSEIIESN